jgi:CheY-like chemotaxis protein
MSSDNLPAPSSDEIASSKPVLPVLVVDDDLVVLDMLRTVLQEQGFAVVGANNGIAARYLLQRTPVALVLTDFMMPGLSGLELADHVRHDPRTATVPVILMSAFPPPDAGIRVAAVISKPFALDELLRVVRQFWPQ